MKKENKNINININEHIQKTSKIENNYLYEINKNLDLMHQELESYCKNNINNAEDFKKEGKLIFLIKIVIKQTISINK